MYVNWQEVHSGKKTAVPGEVNVDKVNLQDPHTPDPDVSLAAVFVKYWADIGREKRPTMIKMDRAENTAML